MDYGQFYHLADSTTTNSYLLSYFILSNTQIVLTGLQAYPTAPSSLTIPSTAFTNYGSGDKLCWGSQSEGIVIKFINLVSNTPQRKLSSLDSDDWNLFLLDLFTFSRTQLNKLL